jgi:hypothetical protein
MDLDRQSKGATEFLDEKVFTHIAVGERHEADLPVKALHGWETAPAARLQTASENDREGAWRSTMNRARRHSESCRRRSPQVALQKLAITMRRERAERRFKG